MRSRPHSVPEHLGSVAGRYRLCTRWRACGRRKLVDRGASPAGDPVAATMMARESRLKRLEGVLFLSREPLNSRRLAKLAGLDDGTEAWTLVKQLNRLYDEHRRAFRVEQVAGGYQLLTRAPFSAWLRRFEHVPSETRLSAPSLETLAVVAYRQPVTRAEIEAVRGVSCGELLRQLMEKDLVRIGGRSEELGRPYLYATTRSFLQVFGLRGLDELPRAQILRRQAQLEKGTSTRSGGDAGPSSDGNSEDSTVMATTFSTMIATENAQEDDRLDATAMSVAEDDEFGDDEFDDGLDDDDDDDLDDDMDEEFDDEEFDDEWEEVDDDEEEYDEWEDDEDDDDWEDDVDEED